MTPQHVPESHTFFGTRFSVPDDNMFPRKPVFGQRKLTELAGIRIENPTFSDLGRRSICPAHHIRLRGRRMRWVGFDIAEPRGDNNRLRTRSNDDFQLERNPPWATKAARRRKTKAKSRKPSSRSKQQKGKNRLSDPSPRLRSRVSDPLRGVGDQSSRCWVETTFDSRRPIK